MQRSVLNLARRHHGQALEQGSQARLMALQGDLNFEIPSQRRGPKGCALAGRFPEGPSLLIIRTSHPDLDAGSEGF